MYSLNPEQMTLTIPIENIAAIMEPVRNLVPPEFRSKEDAHVTLIGFARGREINAELAQLGKDRNVVTQEIQELLDHTSFIIQPTGDYYRIRKEVKFSAAPTELRESIVALLNIPEFDDFWQKLEEILGIQIPVIFPHVTLATYGEGSPRAWEGIGIKDKADFDQLTKEKLL